MLRGLNMGGCTGFTNTDQLVSLVSILRSKSAQVTAISSVSVLRLLLVLPSHFRLSKTNSASSFPAKLGNASWVVFSNSGFSASI